MRLSVTVAQIETMDAYDRVAVKVGCEAEEATDAVLWEMGTLGLEWVDEAADGVRILAYFPRRSSPKKEVIRRRLAPYGAVLVATDEVLESDWMASYREASLPFAVGRGLWVDPREPGGTAVAVPDGRSLLRLPARSAFGIGTHESTRLAVQLLETESVDGRRCLDLGSGSGVLSFLLCRRGARWVVGLDIDPTAALQAAQNATLNHLAPALAAATIEALAARAQFDLCVVNMLPRHLLPLLPAIAARVPVGVVIVSGALRSQDETVSRQLQSVGLRVVERCTDGEWLAYRTVREVA